MHDIEAGAANELVGGEMRRRAGAGRRIAELAGLAFGIIDEFLQRAGRHLAVHHQEQRHLPERSDRDQIGERIVGHVAVQIWIDHDVAGIGDAERVAVGRRLRDRVHRDVAAGARLVVDHHGLAAARRQEGAENARAQIGDAARRGRHDDVDRLGRIGLGVRRRDARGAGHREHSGDARHGAGGAAHHTSFGFFRPSSSKRA
jgi:hypothetical protein